MACPHKMTYNPNIHHRKSIRLEGYDYSQAGLYFVTICCHNHACFFGNIVGTCHGMSNSPGMSNSQIILNDTGKIADEYWLNIPNHFPDVVLHEHIVMPNHIHGIIQIVVGTCHGMSVQNQFGKPIAGSMSIIVNQYKSSVKRWCNKNGHAYFQWQSRFHDHIIQNPESYQTIAEYILNNPANWHND